MRLISLSLIHTAAKELYTTTRKSSKPPLISRLFPIRHTITITATMSSLLPTLTTRDVEFTPSQYAALLASAEAAGISRKDLLRHCTIDICPLDTSYYYYRVSLAANATFLALFALSLIGYLVVSALTWKRSRRSDHAFTFAMASGCILEILGYVGRLMSWNNQWSEDGFLMQIVCLTIAPAFMAGGIYLCLRRIVMVYGAENSRLKPKMYTRIVSCFFLFLSPRSFLRCQDGKSGMANKRSSSPATS